MKLIVGLGNPGDEYKRTYHNIGFMAVDKLAKKLGVTIGKAKFNALYTQTNIKGEIVFLVKPLTYMNNSGEAVAQFCKFYKIEPENVYIICDDIDLEKGVSRFREHGSAGTHNGLKSIVYCLNSENFPRLKIGAGNDKSIPLVDYVLSKIDDESLAQIDSAIDEGLEKVLKLIGNE